MISEPLIRLRVHAAHMTKTHESSSSVATSGAQDCLTTGEGKEGGGAGGQSSFRCQWFSQDATCYFGEMNIKAPLGLPLILLHQARR